MASKPRTIKGLCFDCDEVCDCEPYVWLCSCHFSDGEKTEPAPKLPDDLRPNVPPRMRRYRLRRTRLRR